MKVILTWMILSTLVCLSTLQPLVHIQQPEEGDSQISRGTESEAQEKPKGTNSHQQDYTLDLRSH